MFDYTSGQGLASKTISSSCHVLADEIPRRLIRSFILSIDQSQDNPIFESQRAEGIRASRPKSKWTIQSTTQSSCTTGNNCDTLAAVQTISWFPIACPLHSLHSVAPKTQSQSVSIRPSLISMVTTTLQCQTVFVTGGRIDFG